MNKFLLLIFLLITFECSAQIKFQYVDTLNGKTILREVSYQYPLPLKWQYEADTTKVINWNGSVLTTPFPIKLYNSIMKLISLNIG